MVHSPDTPARHTVAPHTSRLSSSSPGVRGRSAQRQQHVGDRGKNHIQWKRCEVGLQRTHAGGHRVTAGERKTERPPCPSPSSPPQSALWNGLAALGELAAIGVLTSDHKSGDHSAGTGGTATSGSRLARQVRTRMQTWWDLETHRETQDAGRKKCWRQRPLSQRQKKQGVASRSGRGKLSSRHLVCRRCTMFRRSSSGGVVIDAMLPRRCCLKGRKKSGRRAGNHTLGGGKASRSSRRQTLVSKLIREFTPLGVAKLLLRQPTTPWPHHADNGKCKRQQLPRPRRSGASSWTVP